MNGIYLRFPGARARALTLSYDDGVFQDARLIRIMQQHGLKGTFNVNSGLYGPEDLPPVEERVYDYNCCANDRMSLSQAKAVYQDCGMELACHGYSHPHLPTLYHQQMIWEVINDRYTLEQNHGGIIRGMAYPSGVYNDEVIEALKQCGIVYCRTVESTGTFDLPENWLRWHPTAHHSNPKLMELLDRFLGSHIDRYPKLFYLWGHTYEFDHCNNWHVIEDFAASAGGRDNIWYATNLEIYEYVTAYRQLCWTVDGMRVYNPTCLPVWFETDYGTFCVKPGETISQI